MNKPDEWIEKEILITVKAYPNRSKKYGETVCVAGISKEDGWIRLYPVPFRDLEDWQKFKKYQVVKLKVKKQEGDSRPESHRPNFDDMEIIRELSTKGDKNWTLRKEYVLPTLSNSMCEILREQERSDKSLGVFKPKEVIELVIEEDTSKSGNQSMQLSLFSNKQPLEKIPYTFKYHYRCDDPNCNGHEQSISDWEIFALYRRMKREYEDIEIVKEKVREKFIDQLCSPKRDTYFFVGNHSRHRNSFMVLGVFYPPRDPNLPLFQYQ